ncbi:MAG: transcription elongation factor subunit Spt4 [Candidatus Ranarchaeia archaeon]|jgi:DNA-directed RNA polymerase subunit E"
MVKERACRNCQTVFTGSVCPACKSSSTTEDFTGVVMILDPGHSQIAKKLQINEKGKFALKVR